jgi:hypothetical protein
MVVSENMEADRLFIEKNCPHCATIVAALVMEAAMNDAFRAKDGQAFHVFSSLSNAASIELLERFGLAGKHIPVLAIHTGEVFTAPNEILNYLQQQGMAK